MQDSEAGRLYCPNCGEPVGASHINIERLVAVCPVCDAVFYFGGPAPAKTARRKVRQPADVTLREQGDHLALTFPQRISADERKGLLLSIFMALFLGMLVTVLWVTGGPLFFTVLLGLGVLLNLLHVLAISFNTRRVTVENGAVEVRQGPLPMLVPGQSGLFGRETLALQDVVRVYCEQTEESRRSGLPARYYHVCLGLADGERVFLLKALPEAHAFFLAQVIEGYLQEKQGSAADDGLRLAEEEAPPVPDDEPAALDDLLAGGEAGHDHDG